jgi:hypothetical protein
MPPECLVADQTRGRRTPSRHNERLAMTPSEGRGESSISEVWWAGISSNYFVTPGLVPGASAIQREKTMKHWSRSWKIRTIEKMNPTWTDMYEEICR